MRVKVSGFLTSWGFSEKSRRYYRASTHPGEFIWYCEKVVSTGFGVPTFHAVGTKYIFSGGLYMGVYKDKNGRWYVSVRYKNWLGEPSRKTKRGFETKRGALALEREFLQKYSGSLDMTFNSFYEVYRNDLQKRIRQNIWVTKSSIIEKKILPYFGNKRVRDVKPVDVLHWKNIIMETMDENGMPYSPVYLKTIHNQLSAMFNHAVRFYGLPENPAAKAGNMGKEKCGEVLVWTKDEYLQFAETLKCKPASYYAFETLYWCGLARCLR